VARNFGAKAIRPAGLTSRQWRTLQAGLSWHRAGRSISVHTWIQRLTHGTAEKPLITPLRELKVASAAKPLWRSRTATAFLAALLVTGACIMQLRETSAQKSPDGAAWAAPDSVTSHASQSALPSGEASPVDTLVMDARAPVAKNAISGIVQVNPSVRPRLLTISVDSYQLSAGGRFVEVRVHRNQLQKNSSFTWWTEPATARQDIDYVHQAKAIQTFPSERRSTRFYVKLLPDSERSQREFFYVAITQPGHDRNSEKVIRAQVWLPMKRAQLQARR
jgi:hypothetical protein